MTSGRGRIATRVWDDSGHDALQAQHKQHADTCLEFATQQHYALDVGNADACTTPCTVTWMYDHCGQVFDELAQRRYAMANVAVACAAAHLLAVGRDDATQALRTWLANAGIVLGHASHETYTYCASLLRADAARALHSVLRAVCDREDSASHPQLHGVVNCPLCARITNTMRDAAVRAELVRVIADDAIAPLGARHQHPCPHARDMNAAGALILTTQMVGEAEEYRRHCTRIAAHVRIGVPQSLRLAVRTALAEAAIALAGRPLPAYLVHAILVALYPTADAAGEYFCRAMPVAVKRYANRLRGEALVWH